MEGRAAARSDPLTFEVFVVSLQLRGQQAAQRAEAAERRHHRVFVVHVGVVVALPAAQTATTGGNSEEIFSNSTSLYKMTSCDLWDNHSLMKLYTQKLETQRSKKTQKGQKIDKKDTKRTF